VDVNVQKPLSWIAIGEVREGAEADVALALSHDEITIAPSDLENGRHVVIARDEINGELREPRLVSVTTDRNGSEIARFWKIDHQGVALVAQRAYLEFSEGVSYQRDGNRIFVERPLDAQREPEIVVVGRVTREGVASQPWPEGTPKGEGVIVGTPMGVARRLRNLTLVVHDEQQRAIAQRRINDEEIAALYRREDAELSNDVRLVGIGKFATLELSHEAPRSAVHALENTLMPGAGTAHRAIEALERAETIRSLSHDAPHLERERSTRADGRGYERELDFG
jgi:hypothetical protein